MHSPPSPVQPKLCFTSTQTQLLSVITSILGCLSGGWITKAAKHGLNSLSSWWEERGVLNCLSDSIGLISLKLVVWPILCSLLEVSLWSVEQIYIGLFTHRRQVKLLWVRSAACLRHMHMLESRYLSPNKHKSYSIYLKRWLLGYEEIKWLYRKCQSSYLQNVMSYTLLIIFSWKQNIFYNISVCRAHVLVITLLLYHLEEGNSVS